MSLANTKGQDDASRLDKFHKPPPEKSDDNKAQDKQSAQHVDQESVSVQCLFDEIFGLIACKETSAAIFQDVLVHPTHVHVMIPPRHVPHLLLANWTKSIVAILQTTLVTNMTTSTDHVPKFGFRLLSFISDGPFSHHDCWTGRPRYGRVLS